MARKTTLFWKICAVVLLWRVGLFAVGALADKAVEYAPSFPYAYERLAKLNLPRWLYSWANFDGVHYLTIAKHGYLGTGAIQAFFPIFPFLLKVFTSPVIGAVTLNLLLMGCLAGVWQALAQLDQSAKMARWSLLALLLFPTSFFFGAIYTEPLFLLLVFGSFLMARRGNWLWAGILAGLASGTRIIGILLLPALVYELWLQTKPASLKQFIVGHWRELKLISLATTGLALYLLYLWKTFGDPLYFFHVQAEFGAGRQASLILFPQAVWRYVKILLTARPFDWKYFSYAQDFIFSLGTLSILAIWSKKIRPSYLLFSLLAFFLPTLTGTLSSMPRYVLVCFPIFLLLGELCATKPLLRVFLLTASLLLLIMNTILFIQGYWVA